MKNGNKKKIHSIQCNLALSEDKVAWPVNDSSAPKYVDIFQTSFSVMKSVSE